MKTNFTPILILLIATLTASIALNYSLLESRVDLPEEYKAIEKTDRLRGYFVDDRLHLEFDNSIEFIWNDDEESIPMDGSLIRIEFTEGNTVYLSPL